MELKEAIIVGQECLKIMGDTYDKWPRENEAEKVLVETASLVEAMRGKLPEKIKHEHSEYECPICESYQEDYYCEVEKHTYNQAIDDCAAAYVANIPSVSKIRNILKQYDFGLIESDSPSGEIWDRETLDLASAEIHSLIVGKVK